MKVYSVSYIYIGDEREVLDLMGIFSTFEKADEYIKYICDKFGEDYELEKRYYQVIEHTLDKGRWMT